MKKSKLMPIVLSGALAISSFMSGCDGTEQNYLNQLVSQETVSAPVGEAPVSRPRDPADEPAKSKWHIEIEEIVKGHHEIMYCPNSVEKCAKNWFEGFDYITNVEGLDPKEALRQLKEFDRLSHQDRSNTLFLYDLSSVKSSSR